MISKCLRQEICSQFKTKNKIESSICSNPLAIFPHLPRDRILLKMQTLLGRLRREFLLLVKVSCSNLPSNSNNQPLLVCRTRTHEIITQAAVAHEIEYTSQTKAVHQMEATQTAKTILARSDRQKNLPSKKQPSRIKVMGLSNSKISNKKEMISNTKKEI